MADHLQSTVISGAAGSGPDKEVIALMQSILSINNSRALPLSCDDVNSLASAKKEIGRVRKLMDTYKRSQKQQSDLLPNMAKKARAAIHEEEHIDDYVKKDIPKDERTRKLIYDAIKPNVLFESNTEDELAALIDVFEPCRFRAGDAVITQGEKGDEFYVVESGELSITVCMSPDDVGNMDSSVNMVKVGNYQDGSAFGELALIYGSPRAATIAATEDCKLWRIKRGWYRGVVGQHRRRLHREKVEFLPKVKAGKKKFGEVMEKDQLDTMAQLLTQEYFKEGDTIIREGQAGNTFYIIQSGEVNIYKKGLAEPGKDPPLDTWGRERFFGEKALLSDDVRQATVVAASPVVVCFVMARGDFTRVLGNLQDILDGRIGLRKGMRRSTLNLQRVSYELGDLQTMNVLGEGAFGKVKLAKAKDSGKCYALKAQGKRFIIDNGQKSYCLNELRLMKKLSHPNILIMHCAMQDSRYIYFLLDLLPGGELMNILESKGSFSEEWTRFYSASVLLAYNEFHENNVAYRDLKPENLVLDARGYCVVVDLGLAKELADGPTYTFCGTPDYIAPELIRGTGYNWAVDYWALGVLLYELGSGGAPFQSYDPTGTAKKILKGRVNFPSKFSAQMQQIIKGLLTKDPTRRLGCMNDGTEGVMKHRFYHGFDWQGLLDRKIEPPYKPKLPSKIENIGRKDHEKDVAKETKWFPKLD